MTPRTLSAAQPDFTFVVLGDRTGAARHDVFCQVIDEVQRLRPDFVLGVGDLIEGYTDSLATVDAEWDTILDLVQALGVPYLQSPGNHDIFDAQSESVYVARVGRTHFSYRHANSFFIFLDNSRWRSFEAIPDDQKEWLRSELGKARRFRHTFLLMHRPFWKYAREKGRTDSLHILCRQAGIDHVLTGHDHSYCFTENDGIRYYQVGPSGSRYKKYHDPAQGAFQNYLFCRVVGDSVGISVIEPGAVHRPDIVAWETLDALDKARDQAVELAPVPVSSTPVSKTLPLVIHNPTDTIQQGLLAWDYENTAWKVNPGSLNFYASPHADCRYDITFSLPQPEQIYPLPAVALPYCYAPGRSVDIRKPLPTKRHAAARKTPVPPAIDGCLDDPCWQDANPLTDFGSRDGAANPIERTEVSITHDDSLLYVAVRCRESQPGQIAANITQPDDKVYNDDHVNIVIDPNRAATLEYAERMAAWSQSGRNRPVSGPYYQVFINSTGTVADRKCHMEGDESRRDYSWNGDWQVATGRDGNCWIVELSCPLSRFDTIGDVWGINVVRFQSRFKTIGVWQVPFKHDPRTFGILSR